MSRNPPAASRSRAASCSARWAGRVHEGGGHQVGHVATPRPPSGRGRPGDRATTSAPSWVTTACNGGRRPSGSVLAVGVSTQVAPTNRSGSAPATPICSEPAMGWPPTKRGWAHGPDHRPPSPRPRRSPPRRAAGPGRPGRLGARRRPHPTGVATKTTSASGSSPTSSSAPRATGPVGRARVLVAAGDVPAPGPQAQPERAADQPGARRPGPGGPAGPAGSSPDGAWSPRLSRGGHRAGPGRRGGRRGAARPGWRVGGRRA